MAQRISSLAQLLTLPDLLSGAPCLARNSALERGVIEPFAMGMRERVNALASSRIFVVDLLCNARILETANFSSDGLHPSDRGYARMAELGCPATFDNTQPAPAADGA